jgi:outer membrane protein assembly factor BamA
MGHWKRVVIIVWTVSAALIANPAVAQQEDLFADEAELLEILDDEDKNELVVAPIPIVNPTFGTGLAAVGMYLYKLDEGSQESFTAAGGAYTDSKSYGFGIAQVAHFKDDAWKIKAGAVSFNLNLEFFGIGNILGDLGISIPYKQEGWAAGARGLRRIKGNWYGGVQYWYASLTTTSEFRDNEIRIPTEAAVDSKIAGLGVIVEYDSRDNRFNPHNGRLFDATWNYSAEAIGSDFDFSSTDISYNLYHELRPTKVVAGRATLCVTPGEAPFYALCSFGRGNDLRGYVAGRYRDETMVTLQAEYRWNFYKKWGVVAFAGIGQVGENVSDYNTENILPSAGVGLRFMLSKTTKFNLSVDYAVGQDSDALYFYVGESF